MSRLKLSAVLIVTLLLVVVVLQNTQSVETRILFLTVSMPRAVLLLVTTSAGFAVGVLVAILTGKGK
jgi:uncharacterized integral membrane protein